RRSLYGALLIGLFVPGYTSVLVSVALSLQTCCGLSALMAALVGVPSAVLTSISSQVAGRYVLRAGRAVVAWGMTVTLIALGSSVFVVIGVHLWDWPVWWLILTLTVLGGAQGVIVSPNQTLPLIEVAAHVSGGAGGVMRTGQRVGTSSCTARATGMLCGAGSAFTWEWAFVAPVGTIRV